MGKSRIIKYNIGNKLRRYDTNSNAEKLKL